MLNTFKNCCFRKAFIGFIKTNGNVAYSQTLGAIALIEEIGTTHPI
jgi:hypothetical protein